MTELTTAQQLFGGKQLLTKRPEDMDYEVYRLLRRFQDKTIKKIFAKPPNPKIPLPLKTGYNYHLWTTKKSTPEQQEEIHMDGFPQLAEIPIAESTKPSPTT